MSAKSLVTWIAFALAFFLTLTLMNTIRAW